MFLPSDGASGRDIDDLGTLGEGIIGDFREGTEYLFRGRYFMIERFLRFLIQVSGGVVDDYDGIIL